MSTTIETHAAHEPTVSTPPQPRLTLVRKWPFDDTDRAPQKKAGWSPRPIHLALEEIVPAETETTDHHEENPDTALNVRAEESVIAEIARARNEPLWRVGAVARRMSTQIKRSVDVLHDSSKSALRRFEMLPRDKQILWVAAPYVGAAFLVGLLLALDGGGDPVEINAVPAAIAQPIRAPAPPPVQEIVVPPPAAPPVVAAPAAPASREVLERETHQLPVRATLYGRPNHDFRVTKLRARSLVTIYPDFPAADGWVLVVTEKGTVGYLERARLEGVPERVKKHKRKRIRPRRRK